MMPLPKVPTVVYDLDLPGMDRQIKIRAMLMREYKALLKARQFGDEAAFANTILALIKECIIEDVSVEELPMYVVDHIFLFLRAKSVGEEVEAAYICQNPVEKEIDGEKVVAPCGNKLPVVVSLLGAEVIFPENFHRRAVIELNETIGLKLKSPTFKEFMLAQNEDTFDIASKYVFSCVESVYDGDKVLTPGTDFTLEEFEQFLDAFPANKVQKITDFFNTQPTVGLNIDLVCNECGNRETVFLRGVEDFFE